MSNIPQSTLDAQVKNGGVWTCYEKRDGSAAGVNWQFRKCYYREDDSLIQCNEWQNFKPDTTNGECK